MRQYQLDHKCEQNLMRQGYEHVLTFGDNPNNCEEGFEKHKPNNLDGWQWRRAIKLWLKEHPKWIEKKEYKIVRGIGYWRDLHNIVYEVWMRNLPNSQSPLPEGRSIKLN